MTTILCPHCNKALQFDQMRAGQPSSCPFCQGTFLMPVLKAISVTRPTLPVAQPLKQSSSPEQGESLLADLFVGMVMVMIVLGAGAGAFFLMLKSNEDMDHALWGALLAALFAFGFITGGKPRSTFSGRWGTKAGRFISGNWGGSKWGEDTSDQD